MPVWAGEGVRGEGVRGGGGGGLQAADPQGLVIADVIQRGKSPHLLDSLGEGSGMLGDVMIM